MAPGYAFAYPGDPEYRGWLVEFRVVGFGLMGLDELLGFVVGHIGVLREVGAENPPPFG